jgi:hypothetical protein
MANHLARAALLLTVALACSGCVALWQDDHKVEASTGSAVTIEYDPLLLASDRVAGTAQSECAKFQRVAVLDHVRKGLTWTKIADFRCESAPVFLKGSMASLPPETPAASPPYRSLPSPFPAVPPRVASAPAVPPALPAVAANVPSMRIIDASGVTRRQIAKSQNAKTEAAKTETAKTQIAKVGPAKTRVARLQPVRPQIASAQTISHKVRNVPVASLKRSILS